MLQLTVRTTNRGFSNLEVANAYTAFFFYLKVERRLHMMSDLAL